MKTKIIYLLLLSSLMFTACSDVLDKPDKRVFDNETFWEDTDRLRLYANTFYPHFFVGYGETSVNGYAAFANYLFNDDIVINGGQTEFARAVPASKGSVELKIQDNWDVQYTGPDWNFSWVRKSNVMIDRIETRMGDILTEEEYAHWTAVGRFFRALEYARMVNVFGDIQYYDFELTPGNLEELYKDRTPRNEVMDAVYNDFVYAMNNARLTDGAQQVNRFVVAGFVSRWALIEGSWQRYYYKNDERATKFFDLALKAGELVIGSGRYAIETDFRTLFGSNKAPGRDCILFREYGLEITHSIASSCNLNDSRNMGPTQDLIKAFVCNDGQPWETSSVANADNFNVGELIKTRDPRFEATFWHKPELKSKGSWLYTTKFIPRKALEYKNTSGATPAQEWQANKNPNGYPVMRYSEVLLNWIEAKAEIADMGGAAVTQEDITRTINTIRLRPLDSEATDRGVKQTQPMDITNVPNDPSRDPSVSKLLWEIRRERRMEFAFEHSRLIDLRRWKKLEYMDTDKNTDLLRGAWVDLVVDFAAELANPSAPIETNKLHRVTNKSGTLVAYDGTNAGAIKGFYSSSPTKGRRAFLNQINVNPYLSPIGTTQIEDYRVKGFKLTQTEGWPSTIK